MMSKSKVRGKTGFGCFKAQVYFSILERLVVGHGIWLHNALASVYFSILLAVGSVSISCWFGWLASVALVAIFRFYCSFTTKTCRLCAVIVLFLRNIQTVVPFGFFIVLFPLPFCFPWFLKLGEPAWRSGALGGLPDWWLHGTGTGPELGLPCELRSCAVNQSLVYLFMNLQLPVSV
jgi:hypothetical protein